MGHQRAGVVLSVLDRDLLLIGFPLSRVGFAQLACVVHHLMHNDAANLTEVYSACAAECGTTAARVTRNVHCMIDAVYAEGNKRLLEAITYGRPRPTDKEFVYLLAHYLQSRVRAA